ncbi:MAG: hypothetical protein WBB85_23010 [Albidovulum sp.]|uniref:hypothetical protein n=1 Tax=Albidovulum sp. TaxID=1872424 RepID=UPI003CC38EE2
MRILSARISRARRDRMTSRVEAIVALTVLWDGERVQAFIRTSAPARASGAATLRARLLGAAKLSFAVDPSRCAPRRAA